MNEERWLKYARQLGFHDAQYEEAIKIIGIPENPNRLLEALIDVNSRNQRLPEECDKKSTHTSTTPYEITQSASQSANDDGSTSSSCYSSIASVPSSSDRSLEYVQPDILRKIFIDGSNVARS